MKDKNPHHLCTWNDQADCAGCPEREVLHCKWDRRLLTAFLVFVVMGATSERAPAGFAAIAIGLTLSAIHIMAIPVSNASVNPARSLATAVIALGQPLAQVWVFWAAPILGGVAGGLFARWMLEE